MAVRQNLLALSMAAVLCDAHGETITVNSAIDGNLLGNQCTLRRAILAANQNTAISSCLAGSAADVDRIVFDPSISSTITLQQGELSIDSSMVIDGSRPGTPALMTLSGNNASRIFDINESLIAPPPEVSLENLILREGDEDIGSAIRVSAASLTIANTQLTMNNSRVVGGAINSNDTTLVIESGSVFDNNSARSGGAAIDAGGFVGSLSISDTTLSSNQTATTPSSSVGAILTRVNTTIVDSIIDGNNAGDFGIGAIRFSGNARTLTLVNSTVNNNSPSALAIDGTSTMQIFGSTISNNTGGQRTFTDFGSGYLTLSNSTVSANTANLGVLCITDGLIENSTIVNNEEGGLVCGDNVIMRNTIISGSGTVDCDDASVAFTTNLNNHIEDGSCAVGAVNLQSGSPELTPLQNNGGPTLTHAPRSESPLIESGDNADCAAFDQTGMPRPIDADANGSADCDIGAVEFVDLFGPTAMLSSTPDVDTGGVYNQAIVVNFFDDGAIDLNSLDPGDIDITPGPFSVVQTTPNSDGSEVTYQVAPPGGSWGSEDDGAYAITLQDGAVLDVATTGANANTATLLGTFTVAIGEIDIEGNGSSITDGDLSPSAADATDFGEVLINGLAVRTFTISNLGSGEITLSSPISSAGVGFSVSQPGSLNLGAGQNTTFDVNFLPASAGVVTGLVTVSSNDGNENPYTFAVRANAVLSLTDLIFGDGFEN